MYKIKFGTDGWRAIIAKEYTVDNLLRVVLGTTAWLKQRTGSPSVILGHDCRFAGELFAECAAKVFAANGVKVYLAKGPVSTPMVSLGAFKQKTSLGIILTASHNPPSYAGFKLKGSFGGPLLPKEIQEVEDLIPDNNNVDIDSLQLEDFIQSGMVEYIDLEMMYVNHVEENFDMEAIRNSNMNFAFDAMYGSAQDVMRRLMPDIDFLHCEHNPGFNGTPPEPIHRNLQEFSDLIKLSDGEIDCGLATDGDGDRIGLYNSKGVFIDSHHIVLLLIKYLVEEKKQNGKVVISFSLSPKIQKMCEHYGLDYEVVKIGFKHIAGIMLEEDVLLGGEESGGIAIKGHIPERDGIWMGLVIWEYMVKSGKTLDELIEEVYKIVGAFKYERIDLHLKEEDKLRIVANCEKGVYTSFGDLEVRKVETVDGYKYFFDNDEWVMIRASGTEPVLRTYAGAETNEAAFKLLEKTHQTINKK